MFRVTSLFDDITTGLGRKVHTYIPTYTCKAADKIKSLQLFISIKGQKPFDYELAHYLYGVTVLVYPQSFIADL